MQTHNLLDNLKALGLPIIKHLDSIRALFSANPNLVLQAEPGAGKTTIIPLALLDLIPADKKILMLEPRRLAARSSAVRMAEIFGDKVGGTIGYRIKNETRVSAGTRVEVITEGVLTRMLQSDPELPGVALVIFDEFHERSLDADLGLAFSLEVQQTLRDDLKLLVMSATLNGEAVSCLMNKAPVFSAEGRCFPVSVNYAPPKKNQDWSQALVAALIDAIVQSQQDILVFLPGLREIQRASQIAEDVIKSASQSVKSGKAFEIIPLYGDLPFNQQRKALLPIKGKRKIILATNIAETSVTIEGVDCVIDSGLMRQSQFDPNVGFDRLYTRKISAASATQRQGRAGRLGSGTCHRLWSESESLRAETQPEILRADLAGFALELANWGIEQPGQVSLLDQPGKGAFKQAQSLLLSLKALNESRKITRHGKKILSLGIHPRIAHMLIKSSEELINGVSALELACLIAALLQEKDVLRGNTGKEVDYLKRIDWLLANREGSGLAKRIVKQAGSFYRKVSHFSRQSPEAFNWNNIDLAAAPILLAMVFADRIAQKRGAGYRLANGSGVRADDDFVLESDFLVVVRLGGSGQTARIFQAAELSKAELECYFGDDFITTEKVYWDKKSGVVKAEENTCFGELVIESRPMQSLDAELLLKGLLDGVRLAGVASLPWSHELHQWQARVCLLHQLGKFRESFIDVSDAALADSLDIWLAPYLNGMSKLSQITTDILSQALVNMLDWEHQQKLDDLMPARIKVASGSNVKLDYCQGDKPVLAVKLQEMFGEKETPRVAGGLIPLVVHLLSPARRPLQITEDLASFWANSYDQVKKEMKGRYPKHPWPDDPLKAEATRYTKRRS